MANRLKKVFEAKLPEIFTNQEAANDNDESDSDDTIGTCSKLGRYYMDHIIWTI